MNEQAHTTWRRPLLDLSSRMIAGLSKWPLRLLGWIRRVLTPPPDPREGDPALEFMNPRAIIANGRLVVLAFVLIVFGWGGFAPLKSALLAPGTVTVASHRKAIQHLEGGIVKAILVHEGQDVTAGQVLVRLDESQAKASLRMLADEADALTARIARLNAERDGSDDIDFPADLLKRQAEPEVAQAIRGERNAFAVYNDTLGKQTEILKQRNGENATIIEGLKRQQESVEKQIALYNQEIESLEGLYKEKLVTLSRVLALRRQAASLIGQRGQLIEQIAQIDLSSGENEMQITNLRNQYMTDVEKDLRDSETRLFDLQDRHLAAEDVINRLGITAPVAGKVVNLTIHTTGAVIRPGETIMEIVPDQDQLEIEARVRPQDADKIHLGMSARVTLTGYDARRLPSIAGTVNLLSADQLVDQRTGQAYFEMHVLVDAQGLKDLGHVKLIPGLPVEVAVLTGSRTALSYLTEPVTDVFRRGMREK